MNDWLLDGGVVLLGALVFIVAWAVSLWMFDWAAYSPSRAYLTNAFKFFLLLTLIAIALFGIVLIIAGIGDAFVRVAG